MTQSRLNEKHISITSGRGKRVDDVKNNNGSVYGHGLEFVNLVGINNPDGTLNDLELDCIEKFWKPPKCVFIGDDARVGLFARSPSEAKVNIAKAQLHGMWNECECLHFNCHGKFNISRPMESGLVLARTSK